MAMDKMDSEFVLQVVFDKDLGNRLELLFGDIRLDFNMRERVVPSMPSTSP